VGSVNPLRIRNSVDLPLIDSIRITIILVSVTKVSDDWYKPGDKHRVSGEIGAV
jgi:hypothetical protein